MPYLGVGIHENIVVSADTEMKTGNDGKRTLVVGFSTKVATDNMLAAFGGEGQLNASSVGIMMFFKGVTGWQDKVKTWQEVGQDLINLQKQLKDILKCFMVEDKVNSIMTPQTVFKGLGITPANQSMLAEKLVQEEFARKCYENIGDAFVAAVQPFVNGPELRVKLRRTSKLKHFSAIPPVSQVPKVWIESMKIPTENSEIAWDDYEIENGFNSGAPAPSESVPEATAQHVDVMMGGGNTAAAVPAGVMPQAPVAATPPVPTAPQEATTPVMPGVPPAAEVPQTPPVEQAAQPVVPAESAGFDQAIPGANPPAV